MENMYILGYSTAEEKAYVMLILCETQKTMRLWREQLTLDLLRSNMFSFSKFQYQSLTQTIFEMTQLKIFCGTYDPLWVISRYIWTQIKWGKTSSVTNKQNDIAHCYTSTVSLALNTILIGWLVITWPCTNLNVSRSWYIFTKCIPNGIHWGEHDQWPGKARDQNVTKAGGVMFWSSLFADIRKFATSSLQVLEE